MDPSLRSIKGRQLAQSELKGEECIERSKRYGTGLVSKGCAVSGGRHSDKTFEGSREVALIGKPDAGRNRGQRLVGGVQSSAGLFDAQMTNVFSDSAAVKPAELASQVDRVNADVSRYLCDSQPFGEFLAEQFHSLDQPARRSSV